MVACFTGTSSFHVFKMFWDFSSHWKPQTSPKCHHIWENTGTFKCWKYRFYILEIFNVILSEVCHSINMTFSTQNTDTPIDKDFEPKFSPKICKSKFLSSNNWVDSYSGSDYILENTIFCHAISWELLVSFSMF